MFFFESSIIIVNSSSSSSYSLFICHWFVNYFVRLHSIVESNEKPNLVSCFFFFFVIHFFHSFIHYLMMMILKIDWMNNNNNSVWVQYGFLFDSFKQNKTKKLTQLWWNLWTHPKMFYTHKCTYTHPKINDTIDDRHISWVMAIIIIIVIDDNDYGKMASSI